MNFENQTLASLATSVPGAAGVFRRHRLDFCCNGDRTLAEACAIRSVEPAAVVEALSALSTREPTPLASLELQPPAELVDYVVRRYHDPLRAQLADLLAFARRVEKVHAQHPHCPVGLADALDQGGQELNRHMDKEERALFPAIRQGLTTQLAPPIAMMRQEHEEHGAFLERLRELTRDFTLPADACRTWRALYLGLEALEAELHEHVLVENHLIFPRVLGARGAG